MRYAIYFTPGPEHRLTHAAGRWLGRDVFSGQIHPAPQDGLLTSEEHRQLTASPRHYGFHATIVAPFRLADGANSQALVQALATFSAGRVGFEIAQLEIARIGAFYALVPKRILPLLQQLADEAVKAFVPFRAPLSAAEVEKRGPSRLTPSQRAYLQRWGYPYVFEEFLFHMTLTGPTLPQDRGRIERALHQWFDPVLDGKVVVEALALFAEERDGAPLLVQSTAPLTDSRMQHRRV